MGEEREALPEPAGVIIVGTQALRAFTAVQMQAYGDARAQAARMEAMAEAEQHYAHVRRALGGKGA